MSWTHVATASGVGYGSTQVDTTTELTVQVGDVLVGIAQWEDGTVPVVSIAATTGENALAVLSEAYGGGNFSRMAWGVVTAPGTFTFRVTWSSGAPYSDLVVAQFRPPAGATVSLDAGPSAAGADTGTQMLTGTINTTGVDTVAVAGMKSYSTRTQSAHQIGGIPATVLPNPSGRGHLANSFVFLSAPQSGVQGVVTVDSPIGWVGDIVAIKAVSSSPSLSPNSISATPVLGQPSISQRFDLNPDGVTAAPVLGHPTIGQTFLLSPTGVSAVPVLGHPTVSQRFDLVPVGVSLAPLLGQPTLSQVRPSLTPQGVTVTPELGHPVIGQAPTTGPTLVEVFDRSSGGEILVAARVVTADVTVTPRMTGGVVEVL